MASIDSKIDSVAQEIQQLAAEVKNDEAARKKLQGVAMGAVAQLDTPAESVWKLIMSPHAPSALMILVRLGVVNKLASSDSPMTAAELAKTTGGDELLIIRMIRPLIAMGFFKETDQFTYAPTPITHALATPALSGGFQAIFAGATHSLARMPFYLEETKFRHVDGFPGPFQHVKGKIAFFQWLIDNPEMMSHFNNFMSESRLNRPDWFTRLSIEEMFLDGASTDPEAVLLIDIAGGEGHDIQAFHKAFPNAPGKLVLEELPPVLENIQTQGKDVSPEIVRQPIDFFEPQPIKGARVYYFRQIFHDWPDADCIKILKNTAAAMKKGYSKLIINEFILPLRNVPLYPALLDVNMMCVLNGMERTTEQWTKLLDVAGLKVLKWHQFSESGDEEGIIEAELKD